MYMRKAGIINRRRGTVLQLACVTFIGILFLGALAIDGGNLLAARRQAQNCCDSAALAACIKLAAVQAQGGTPTVAQVSTAANEALSANNYINGTNCTVTVNSPPTSGAFQDSNSVELLLKFTYSNLVVTGTDAVTVRSVASVTTSDSPSVPILLIDPTANGEVFSIYSGEFTLNLVPMHINSTSPFSAVVAGGMQGTIANVTLDLVGGYSGSFNPLPTGGAVPIANPYALVQPPSTAGLASFDQSSYLPDAGNNITLNPGYYPNGIKITDGGNVTLNSGTYSIGKGLWINTPGTVTGNQVMLYVSGMIGEMDEEGFGAKVAMWLSPTDGNYTFTPPTSGPYAGLSFFTDPGNAGRVWYDLFGTGALTAGIQYYPSSMLRLWTPQGQTGNVISNELVAKDLRLSGKHDIYKIKYGMFTKVNWKASRAANRPPTNVFLAE
jgi:Flp pilus assembly protein TadG